MNIRRGILGAMGVLSVLAISGCVVFKATPLVAQNGQIGAVRITVTACASQSSGSPPGSCTNQGHAGSNASSGPAQAYLAFRVPTQSVPPSSLRSIATGPSNTGPQLNFTRSLSYTAELQRLQPAPPGEQWVGYVSSQYVMYNGSSGEQNFTASADFALAPNPDGSPYRGPFTYQAVVGERDPNAGTPDPNAPVTCGSSLTTRQPDPGTQTNYICDDDSYPATLGSDAALATRDARVQPGRTVRLLPGRTADVPFTFAYAGSSPAGPFTFAASTNLPDVAAFPDPASLTVSATSSTAVIVSVVVPTYARSGTYTVTLVATAPDGSTRSANATVTVLKACRVPRLKGQKLRRARRLLRSASCRLGKVRRRRAPRRGRVISQNPKPGNILPAASKVRVTVSRGSRR